MISIPPYFRTKAGSVQTLSPSLVAQTLPYHPLCSLCISLLTETCTHHLERKKPARRYIKVPPHPIADEAERSKTTRSTSKPDHLSHARKDAIQNTKQVPRSSSALPIVSYTRREPRKTEDREREQGMEWPVSETRLASPVQATRRWYRLLYRSCLASMFRPKLAVLDHNLHLAIIQTYPLLRSSAVYFRSSRIHCTGKQRLGITVAGLVGCFFPSSFCCWTCVSRS